MTTHMTFYVLHDGDREDYDPESFDSIEEWAEWNEIDPDEVDESTLHFDHPSGDDTEVFCTPVQAGRIADLDDDDALAAAMSEYVTDLDSAISLVEGGYYTTSYDDLAGDYLIDQGVPSEICTHVDCEALGKDLLQSYTSWTVVDDDTIYIWEK